MPRDLVIVSHESPNYKSLFQMLSLDPGSDIGSGRGGEDTDKANADTTLSPLINRCRTPPIMTDNWKTRYISNTNTTEYEGEGYHL
jgi:hypothetical protein